jgi:hypothetical protein
VEIFAGFLGCGLVVPAAEIMKIRIGQRARSLRNCWKSMRKSAGTMDRKINGETSWVSNEAQKVEAEDEKNSKKGTATAIAEAATGCVVRRDAFGGNL